MILLPLLLYAVVCGVDAAGYGSCPYRCECQPHHTVPAAWQAKCAWEHLPEGAPFAVSSSIRSLRIECTNSSMEAALTRKTLAGLSQLHELHMENCALSGVEEDAFSSVGKLRELWLEGLKGRLRLTPALLRPLAPLQKLHVAHSALSSLPSDLFCLLPSLQMLNVSGNALTESALPSNASCTAHQLIIVDLSRNELRELLPSTLAPFPAARQLLLGWNSISSIHSLAFSPTQFLQQLHINNNRVAHLPALPHTVVSVDASVNVLTTLPPSIAVLPSLVFLNLSHNALQSPLAELETSDLEVLDVSHNRLSSLPSLSSSNVSSSLHHLHLSHNSISSLSPSGLSPFSALHTLDLSWNGVKEVKEGTFSSLSSLSTLILSHNSLSSLPLSSLALLTLHTLDLSYNKLATVPGALSQLSRCSSLVLAHNSIASIAHSVLSRVPHLSHLDLSFNSIEKLSEHDVSNSTSLAHLQLSHNVIRDISPSAFTNCDSLRRMDLSHNRLSSLHLQSSLTSLRKLNVSHNLMGELDWEGVPTKVDHFNADHNRIGSIRGNPLNHRVRHLSLSHNALRHLSSPLLPDSLETLNLTYNSIGSLAPMTLASKASLSSVDVSWNVLTSVSLESVSVPDALVPVVLRLRGNPLLCTCELEWVKTHAALTKKSVEVVDGSETECIHLIHATKIPLNTVTPTQLLCNYTRMCERGCRCCEFSPASCVCNIECPAGCECWKDATHTNNHVRCNALQEEDAQMFNVKKVPRSVTHLYISNFPLHSIQDHAFQGRTSLTHLHINNTQLRSIGHAAFKNPQLQLLDLSNNELEELKRDSFNGTEKITHLFLDNNRMRRVDEGLVKELPSLQVITLHRNHLSSLPEVIGRLQSTLGDNHFRCDCQLDRFTFPNFYLRHKDNIVDAPSVKCSEDVTRAFRQNDTTVLSAYAPNRGDDIFEMGVEAFLHEYNSTLCVVRSGGVFSEGAHDVFLIVLLAVVLLLLLCCCILLCIFSLKRSACSSHSKRYKLTSSSLNCSTTTPGTSPLPHPLLGHDLFLSYSAKDEKLVEEVLVTRLNADFSICMQMRDGPPYETYKNAVNDELTRSMRDCKTIIVFLTKNYVEREWNDALGLRVSCKIVAKDLNKKFVAIVADDIDVSSMNEELGHLLRKKKVLRLNDPLFSTMLESVLPHEEALRYQSDSSSQIYSEMYGGIIVPSAIV